MTPTEMHETLDERGLLGDAHGLGTYALRVRTPDTAEGVARAFLSVADVSPPDPVLHRLTAERVAYVGASGDVYDRLMDHADGTVRRATFLAAFEAVDVVDVWPSEMPFREEYNRAAKLSRGGWTCWQDGEVL